MSKPVLGEIIFSFMSETKRTFKLELLINKSNEIRQNNNHGAKKKTLCRHLYFGANVPRLVAELWGHTLIK